MGSASACYAIDKEEEYNFGVGVYEFKKIASFYSI